jgi:hypothetical protein
VGLDPRSRATKEDLVAQRDLALRACATLREMYARMPALSAPAGPARDALQKKIRAVEVKLRSVLQVALSADRQPPAAALALYEEARADWAAVGGAP